MYNIPGRQVVDATVTHLGPLGAGLIGKLANNLILGVGRLAIAEAMAMAQKAGVPLDALYQTLKTCTADSRLLRSLEGAVLRGEYPPMTFHAVKDLSAAVDRARSVQQAMPVTSLSLALYQLANDKLGGLQTSTEVYATSWITKDAWRQSAGRRGWLADTVPFYPAPG